MTLGEWLNTVILDQSDDNEVAETPQEASSPKEILAAKRPDPAPRRDGDTVRLEDIAEQPARGLGNDDRVRLGDALKACREVRRLADNTALLRFAGPDQISDDHQAGGSPDPHL